MSLFGAPVLRRVTKPTPVLDGGRTRLRVEVAGWGRLTLAHAAPDGAVMRRRAYFFGGERELFVDVLPPCEVTVVFGNLFGADSATVAVQAEAAGVAAPGLPEVAPLPAAPLPAAPLPAALRPSSPDLGLRLPATPRIDTPRLRLGTVSLNTQEIEWREET